MQLTQHLLSEGGKFQIARGKSGGELSPPSHMPYEVAPMGYT